MELSRQNGLVGSPLEVVIDKKASDCFKTIGGSPCLLGIRTFAIRKPVYFPKKAVCYIKQRQ